MLALMLAIVALRFELFFVWGIFCWFWGWENLKHREAFFVEKVNFKANPIVFTAIIISWFVVGVFYFYSDLRVTAFISTL